jgi:hypothetical protein
MLSSIFDREFPKKGEANLALTVFVRHSQTGCSRPTQWRFRDLQLTHPV